MLKFLITGARAPVALELARNLYSYGHKLYIADSLKYPLTKNSVSIEGHFYISSPRESIECYKNDLVDIIRSNNIDYLIPTCEEVFYISYIKECLEKECSVFCSEFTLMKELHSKESILKLVDGLGVLTPSTNKLNLYEVDNNNLEGKILKKEFSRFGTSIIFNPSTKSVRNISRKEDWLIQDRIVGYELCTYAMSVNGEVLFQSIYEPTHRVKIAAGIYFKPVNDEKISSFVREFCKKYNYTGHIGFDLIVNDQGIYVIECNPRATSGLHLLYRENLGSAFLPNPMKPGAKRFGPRMISLAMVLIGLPLAIINRRFDEWKADYSIAEDVISIDNDKRFTLFQFISLAELVFIAIKKRVSIRAASTWDIEWDGEEIK